MYADVLLQNIKRMRAIFSAREKTSVAYLLLPFKRLNRPLAGFFVLVPYFRASFPVL
jgi:hypothetical protein